MAPKKIKHIDLATDAFDVSIIENTCALSSPKIPTKMFFYVQTVESFAETKTTLQLTDVQVNILKAAFNCPVAVAFALSLRSQRIEVPVEFKGVTAERALNSGVHEASFLAILGCFIQGTRHEALAAGVAPVLNKFVKSSAAFSSVQESQIGELLNGSYHGFNPISTLTPNSLWTKVNHTKVPKELKSRVSDKSANSSVPFLFYQLSNLLVLLGENQDERLIRRCNEIVVIYSMRGSVMTMMNTFKASLEALEISRGLTLAKLFLDLSNFPHLNYHPFSPTYVAHSADFEKLRDTLMWVSFMVLYSINKLEVSAIVDIHKSSKATDSIEYKAHRFQTKTAPRNHPANVIPQLVKIRGVLRGETVQPVASTAERMQE